MLLSFLTADKYDTYKMLSDMAVSNDNTLITTAQELVDRYNAIIEVTAAAKLSHFLRDLVDYNKICVCTDFIVPGDVRNDKLFNFIDCFSLLVESVDISQCSSVMGWFSYGRMHELTIRNFDWINVRNASHFVQLNNELDTVEIDMKHSWNIYNLNYFLNKSEIQKVTLTNFYPLLVEKSNGLLENAKHNWLSEVHIDNIHAKALIFRELTHSDTPAHPEIIMDTSTDTTSTDEEFAKFRWHQEAYEA